MIYLKNEFNVRACYTLKLLVARRQDSILDFLCRDNRNLHDLPMLRLHSLETQQSFDDSRAKHDMAIKFTSIDFSCRITEDSRSSGCKSWVTNLSIIFDTLGILTASITYSIKYSIEYVYKSCEHPCSIDSLVSASLILLNINNLSAWW